MLLIFSFVFLQHDLISYERLFLFFPTWHNLIWWSRMWSTLEKIPRAAEKNSVAVRWNVLFISIKQFDLCYSLTLWFLSGFSVRIPDLEMSMRYQNHPLLLYHVPCNLLCPLVFILWSWEPQYSTHICLGLLYILCILYEYIWPSSSFLLPSLVEINFTHYWSRMPTCSVSVCFIWTECQLVPHFHLPEGLTPIHWLPVCGCCCQWGVFPGDYIKLDLFLLIQSASLWLLTCRIIFESCLLFLLSCCLLFLVGLLFVFAFSPLAMGFPCFSALVIMGPPALSSSQNSLEIDHFLHIPDGDFLALRCI